MKTLKKTVYLVDDNITNLTIGSSALEGAYNVVTFNSGARLIKALTASANAGRHLPNVVLLDVNMPEMDGYEVIARLKSIDELKHIPVIFLTATINEDEKAKGIKLGAADYVTKPFAAKLLIETINRHL